MLRKSLWRVDYRTHFIRRRVGHEIWYGAAGWFDTKKAAMWFILNKAALPCRIVHDSHPEKHPQWPKEAR